MQLIDLSHTIEDGLVTYKGLPAPVICNYLSREESRKNYVEGTEFQIGKIEMVANTGTYIDCPLHRYSDGKDLSEIGLKKIVDLDALIVRYNYEKEGLAIDKNSFEGLELESKVVLVNTNWDKHWNTETYYENHPYLTEGAAQFLFEAGVSLVGIDSYNIDNSKTNKRPVHSILLKNEILIVEHMTCLSLLPDTGFLFSAIPPKIKGMGSYPVRAYAKVI